jgi:single-stranded DNA-specific DHH superfamily exonuclease
MTMSTLEQALGWLHERHSHGNRVCVFYHADVDGCVSAAYWSSILTALEFRITTEVIHTSELGFERVGHRLTRGDLDLAVFLDVPAGTRFPEWQSSLPMLISVFVYDHHAVDKPIKSHPPRFVQFREDAPGDLEPTCLFSHKFYGSVFGSAPDWLITVGLLGEGQQARFPEYITGWPLARRIVSLIAHGVLREDQEALSYLRYYLDRGGPPPHPDGDDRATKLRKTSEEVAAEIESFTNLILRDTNRTFVAGRISNRFPIANYVASNVRQRRPNAVVLVGELSDPGLLRGEIRLGRRRDMDLRVLVADAKRQGLLLGGGGHRGAVGVRLRVERWDDFVTFLRARAGDVEQT